MRGRPQGPFAGLQATGSEGLLVFGLSAALHRDEQAAAAVEAALQPCWGQEGNLTDRYDARCGSAAHGARSCQPLCRQAKACAGNEGKSKQRSARPPPADCCWTNWRCGRSRGGRARQPAVAAQWTSQARSSLTMSATWTWTMLRKESWRCSAGRSVRLRTKVQRRGSAH